jgi:Mrp family chromosome partitioning ATPase
MSSLSTESTPRERLSRLLTLLGRTRMFWRSATALAILGAAMALGVALCTKRIYRSETTVLYRDGMAPGAPEGESPAARAARLGPKLKDLIYARPNLEQIIRDHGLFPEKTRKSMLDAVEEMTTAVGFHARAGDSFVISFSYEDPAVAERIAALLAARMIDEHNRQNLDTATLTRDFLRRKLAEASADVDTRSRALATFLADHPQFQWGGADSPYAPAPGGAPAPRLAPTPRASVDPVTRELERELGRVEGELLAPAAPGAPSSPTEALAEAQRRRDAAHAALSAAEAARAERLTAVTPAHPDAIAADGRVAAARQALEAADSALARVRLGEARITPRADLPPERRATLERERAALRRRLEQRRGAGPAAEAPRNAAAPTDVVELETEWHRLRMALDRSRAELLTIQQNARAADLSADAVAKQGHAEMLILEPAYLPTRPDRGRGRVFFAGLTIALFLALGYAAARVLLNDTLLDAGDVAALGGPPVLVALPRWPAPPARGTPRSIIPAVRCEDEDDDLDPPSAPVVITPAPGSPLSSRALALRADAHLCHALVEAAFDDPEVELLGADVDPLAATRVLASAPPAAISALRVLRHRLEQRRGDGSFVVSLLSPGPAEGKTALALRLALTLAEAERARVILVEGNFDRPRLAAELGLRLPPEASFSAQIRRRMGGRGVPWGVVRLGPSLALLAEPEEHAAHPETLHSTHFQSAVSALRRSYEYVVIDGPGIVGSGDANVLEAVSDGVLVVVRARATRGTALTRATEQLGSPRLLGVVLNDAVIG